MKKIHLFFVMACLSTAALHAQFTTTTDHVLVNENLFTVLYQEAQLTSDELNRRRYTLSSLEISDRLADIMANEPAPYHEDDPSYPFIIDKVEYSSHPVYYMDTSGIPIHNQKMRMLVIRPRGATNNMTAMITHGGRAENDDFLVYYDGGVADMVMRGYTVIYYENPNIKVPGEPALPDSSVYDISFDWLYQQIQYMVYQYAVAARQYISANASTYEINNNQVFGMGNSNGGAATIHLAYIDPATDLTDPLLSNLGAYDAYSDHSGQSIALESIACRGTALTDGRAVNGYTAFQNLMGDIFDASDVSTPCLFIHGEDDPTVDMIYTYTDALGNPLHIEGPLLLRNKLEREGIPNYTIISCGGGHFQIKDIVNGSRYCGKLFLEQAVTHNSYTTPPASYTNNFSLTKLTQLYNQGLGQPWVWNKYSCTLTRIFNKKYELLAYEYLSTQYLSMYESSAELFNNNSVTGGQYQEKEPANFSPTSYNGYWQTATCNVSDWGEALHFKSIYGGQREVVRIDDDNSIDFGTGPFTFEVRLSLDATQSFNYPQILSNRGGYFDGFLFSYAPNGRVFIQADGVNHPRAITSIDASHGCVHIAATRDNAGTLTYYINGVKSGVFSGVTQDISTNHELYIGNDFTGYGINATIYEVRLWNIERTEAQIIASADPSNLPPPGSTAGTVAYYTFTEGQGITTTDHSPNHNTGYLGHVVNPDLPEWEAAACLELNDPTSRIMDQHQSDDTHAILNQFADFPVNNIKKKDAVLDTDGQPATARVICYPNPANDRLHVMADEQLTDILVEIYSAHGVLAMPPVKMASSHEPIDISQLQSGSYVVKVKHAGSKGVVGESRIIVIAAP